MGIYTDDSEQEIRLQARVDQLKTQVEELQKELEALKEDAFKLAQILTPSYCRYKKETEAFGKGYGWEWEAIALASERILDAIKPTKEIE